METKTKKEMLDYISKEIETIQSNVELLNKDFDSLELIDKANNYAQLRFYEGQLDVYMRLLQKINQPSIFSLN
jgi:hypothetical protein